MNLLEALGSDRYTPWGVCLADDKATVFFYTLTNTLAMISYMIIGAVIILRWLRKTSSPMTYRKSLAPLYGSFIFLCGMSSLTQTLTLHLGIYRLDIFVTAAMTGVALAAAIFTLKDLVGKA